MVKILLIGKILLAVKTHYGKNTSYRKDFLW
jgi:hypothetical protein